MISSYQCNEDFELPFRHQRVSEERAIERIAGLHFQELAKLRDGLRALVQFDEHQGVIIPRRGEPGLKLQASLQQCFRVDASSLAQRDSRQQIVRVDIVRLGFEKLKKRIFHLAGIAAFRAPNHLPQLRISNSPKWQRAATQHPSRHDPRPHKVVRTGPSRPRGSRAPF